MTTTQTNIIVAYCPICNEDRKFVRETREQAVVVRRTEVKAEIPSLVCPVCGDVQPDPDHDPMRFIYRAYRQIAGLLDTNDIIRIRKQYGLSREAFASLLGMSPASLYRYEGGALQDEAHDELLRSCDDPRRMIDLVNRHRNKLSNLQYQRFSNALRSLPLPVRMLTWSEACATEDEYSGNRSFSYKRYAYVINTLLSITGPTFNTKLNKLLFYVDFLAFALRNRSITGSRYRAIQHGPVPADYDALLERLEEDEFIERTEIDFNGYSGVRISAGNRVSPEAMIDGTERLVIQHIASTFHNWTAKQVRDFSHSEVAYKDTEQRRLISYRFADQLKIKHPKI